jgi:hypothetical protein
VVAKFIVEVKRFFVQFFFSGQFYRHEVLLVFYFRLRQNDFIRACFQRCEGAISDDVCVISWVWRAIPKFVSCFHLKTVEILSFRLLLRFGYMKWMFSFSETNHVRVVHLIFFLGGLPVKPIRSSRVVLSKIDRLQSNVYWRVWKWRWHKDMLYG